MYLHWDGWRERKTPTKVGVCFMDVHWNSDWNMPYSSKYPYLLKTISCIPTIFCSSCILNSVSYSTQIYIRLISWQIRSRLLIHPSFMMITITENLWKDLTIMLRQFSLGFVKCLAYRISSLQLRSLLLLLLEWFIIVSKYCPISPQIHHLPPSPNFPHSQRLASKQNRQFIIERIVQLYLICVDMTVFDVLLWNLK